MRALHHWFWLLAWIWKINHRPNFIKKFCNFSDGEYFLAWLVSLLWRLQFTDANWKIKWLPTKLHSDVRILPFRKKTHTLYVIKNNHKMQHIKQDFSRFALEALLLGQNFISRTISPPRTLLLIKSSLKERENRTCR